MGAFNCTCACVYVCVYVFLKPIEEENVSSGNDIQRAPNWIRTNDTTCANKNFPHLIKMEWATSYCFNLLDIIGCSISYGSSMLASTTNAHTTPIRSPRSFNKFFNDVRICHMYSLLNVSFENSVRYESILFYFIFQCFRVTIARKTLCDVQFIHAKKIETINVFSSGRVLHFIDAERIKI